MTATTHTTPAEWCVAHDACSEAREWASQYATLADAWDACPRAGWLIWALERLDLLPDDRTLRLYACWCVRNTPLADGRTTWDLLTDARHRHMIETTERYVRGECTADDAVAAVSDAWDAAPHIPPDGPWRVAWAARRACAWVEMRVAATAIVCSAATASAWAADGDVALAAALAAQAAHLRTLVPNPFRHNSDGVTTR